MRALILAAGRGERMRPLTDSTPKPLLPVHGRALIEWHLLALARDGVREVVINTAWLEDQFPERLGDGSRYGLAIRYSTEGRDHGGALETAGGIAKALPWLTAGGEEAFWVVSGDVWAPDFRFDAELARGFVRSGLAAHLWLVPNPPFHARGDFGQAGAGTVPGLPAEAAWGVAGDAVSEGQRRTYANLALVHRSLCAHLAAGMRAPLGPLLQQGMLERRISVQGYAGRWHNLGTPGQLAALNASEDIPHVQGALP
jgi:MurNAc alpha-1-phosphate uridylyltransferase